MNKRTAEEEVKYQDSLKQKKMRTAFVVLFDLMRANEIEYPFAVIWQTFDENGKEDYTVMRPSDTWNVDHGNKQDRLAEIVHENVAKAEQQ